MNKNIKYVFIGNLSTKKILIEEDVVKIPECQKDATQIFEKYCNLRDTKFDENNKIPSSPGNYCVVTHRPHYFYLVLVEKEYSVKLAFEMVQEVHDSDIKECLDQNKEINLEGKTKLKFKISNYQNKKDTIKELNLEIDDIRVGVKDNIRQVINNNDNLDSLQNQSNAIKESSLAFRKDAKEAKNITCRNNCKWTVIIILALIVVVLVIVLPIVLTKSKTSDVTPMNTNSTGGL